MCTMQQFWNIHQNLTFWMASAFLAGESALGIPMVGIPHSVTSACRNAYADGKCPFFLWDSSKTFQYIHLHRQAYRLTDMAKLIGPFWQLLVVNMPKNERFHSYTQVLVITSITGYCYGVVSYKASHALRPFSALLCVPHLNSNSWFIHQSSLENTSRNI
jgi:hypothetical protein